ncbi:MAG TPA: hypothetical protein VGR35_07040 [Tepidisphaeraceae bacterium]|nr:hypothetical protein [Tepidisphaeraceae bacterium]
MRHRLLSFILLAIAACGCDDGAQHGLFAVAGSSSRSVAAVPGSLTIVRGDPQPLTPQSKGQQPLLYILALAPSISASGSGSANEDGTYVSTYREIWDTVQGKVAVELSWDRRTDKVSAAGATFDRTRGNAFVLLREPSGKVSATQLGPFDAGLDPFVALEQMQAALPAGSPAKHVALVR